MKARQALTTSRDRTAGQSPCLMPSVLIGVRDNPLRTERYAGRRAVGVRISAGMRSTGKNSRRILQIVPGDRQSAMVKMFTGHGRGG